MSIRDKIRAAEDRGFEDVTIEEWDVTVRVTALSAAEIISLSDMAGDGKRLSKALLARSLTDESGGRIYDDESIDELFDKNMTGVGKLLAAARRLNGMEHDEAKKD
jgi:hypothetical protein